jgi:hypothetical protein
MKIVKNSAKEIGVSEVTNSHIIVVKINGEWAILIAKSFNSDEYKVVSLGSGFTRNDGWTQATTIYEWITRHSVSEAHAFNSFKEACEFLITVLD